MFLTRRQDRIAFASLISSAAGTLGLRFSLDDERVQFDYLIAAEAVDVTVRVWRDLSVLFLHGHVAIRRDEVTVGDYIIDRKLRRLHFHRSHPFANGVLSSGCFMADHG